MLRAFRYGPFLFVLCTLAFANDDCARIVVNHPGVQIELITTSRWRAVVDSLYTSQLLTPEDGYFSIPRKESFQAGFDPDRIEASRLQLRKFAVGVTYDLILSKLAREVGTLGGNFSFEASLTYYLSHVRAPHQDGEELKQRTVADRLFRDLPSIDEMEVISNDPALDNAATEMALAKALEEGLARFQSSLNHPQIGIELQALMTRELGASEIRVSPSRSYALTTMQWSGPYHHNVPQPPAVTLQYARQIGFNVPLILVDLDGFRDARVRPLHRAVNFTAVLEYDRHRREVIGAALEIPSDRATTLSEKIKQVQGSL